MENIKNMSDADALQFFSNLVNSSQNKPVFVLNDPLGLVNENETDFDVFQSFYSCVVIDNHPELDDTQVLNKCKETWETISEKDRYILVHGSPQDSNQLWLKFEDIAKQ